MNEPLDEDMLLTVLKEQWERARDYYNSTIADEQEASLKFYDAEPFGDEIEGQSQIVLPDVQEVVDYMTISVLRLFISGDRVVEFEARSPDDAEKVDEVTEAVAQTFMRGQDGFRVLHDTLKAGLIEKIGIVKSTATTEAKVITERFVVDEEQLATLPEEVAATAMMGDGGIVVTVRREVSQPKFYDYTVPSEEFRCSPRARHEDDADYLAHACLKTRSDLVEMGFDQEAVYDLPTGDDPLWEDGRQDARDREEWLQTNSNTSMQEVLLLEEYVKIDADGDGIAERLKVFRVADKILSVEIVNEQPFTIFCPFPRPHRLIGDGLADKAKDIQRIRSVIARQLLNAMYQHNTPRYWVPQESVTENTFDDLLETVGPVRGKGAAPQMLGGQFDVSKSLGVLEFFTGERESRTGITRLNQGIDAEALNKTATGTALQQAQGQQYEEFIARNFAEWLSRLFVKKMRLMKSVGEPVSVKVDGQFIQSDPETWPEDADVVIRVGLGTGRKDQRIALLSQMLQIQREGMANGMVGEEHIFKTVSGIVRDAGLGQPDDYWRKPDPNAEPAEKPDPAMAEIEAKAQLDAAKLQGEQQIAATRLQIMQQEAELKAQLARDEAAAELELAERKFEAERQLALQRMAFEQSLAARKAQDVNLPDNRPGGSLAE